jgi:glutamate-5-semialdehyde dehydrogenase
MMARSEGTLRAYARKIAREARVASGKIACLASKLKDAVLCEAAGRMRRERASLVRENARDLAFARESHLPAHLMDRLVLNEGRIRAMAESIEAVAALRDPVGRVLGEWTRPNGLRISKVTVPLGVILIIYEARPNVTQECAALCLKSGNSVILRGGKEAFHSNRAIAGIFRGALASKRLDPAAVTMVGNTDRRVVNELLKLSEDIHLVIPRGGESLIRKVAAKSRIPVIKHYRGNCHVYVDKSADLKQALSIAYNAKCQRPGVCNAMETLLVHRAVAPRFLPRLQAKLTEARCEIRGCKETRNILPRAKKATEKDWYAEYLDLILAVRVVRGVEEAIRHIETYGSHHTDAIVTGDKKAAEEFVRRVDSSSVMVNTTTRFSDGFQYGFGAEIGISTDKIHARGPMGLEGLTSYKYVVKGNGQLRT